MNTGKWDYGELEAVALLLAKSVARIERMPKALHGELLEVVRQEYQALYMATTRDAKGAEDFGHRCAQAVRKRVTLYRGD